MQVGLAVQLKEDEDAPTLLRTAGQRGNHAIPPFVKGGRGGFGEGGFENPPLQPTAISRSAYFLRNAAKRSDRSPAGAV